MAPKRWSCWYKEVSWKQPGEVVQQAKRFGFYLQAIGSHWKCLSREGSNQKAYIMASGCISYEYFVCSFQRRSLRSNRSAIKEKNRALNFVSNRDGLLDHLLHNEGNNWLLFSVSCPIIPRHFTNKHHLSFRAEAARWREAQGPDVLGLAAGLVFIISVASRFFSHSSGICLNICCNFLTSVSVFSPVSQGLLA